MHTPSSKTHSGLRSRAPLGRSGVRSGMRRARRKSVLPLKTAVARHGRREEVFGAGSPEHREAREREGRREDTRAGRSDGVLSSRGWWNLAIPSPVAEDSCGGRLTPSPRRLGEGGREDPRLRVGLVDAKRGHHARRLARRHSASGHSIPSLSVCSTTGC